MKSICSLLALVVLASAATVSAQSDSCGTQDLAMLLNEIIETSVNSSVAAALANEPGM